MEENQQVIVNKQKGMPVNLWNIVIIALLCFNIIVSVFSIFTGASGVRSPETIIRENNAYEQYLRDTGKKNFTISGDKVVSTTYGSKSIDGTLTNTSKKAYSVSVDFILYEDDTPVGTASDYIGYVSPGAEIKFSASAYDVDSFDKYELNYISATEEN